MTHTIETIRSNAKKGDTAAQFQLAVLHLHVEKEADIEICPRPSDFQSDACKGLNILKGAALNHNKEACIQLGKILMNPDSYFINAAITQLNLEEMHRAGVQLLHHAGTLKNADDDATNSKGVFARLFDAMTKPFSEEHKLAERHWWKINHATDMLIVSIMLGADKTSFDQPHRAVA